MPDIRNHECLSFGDALFLYLEREGMPLNVAAIAEFEGIVPLQLCIDFVESKLPLLPRYRQCAVMPLFNIGLPTWEYDRNFDLRNHIREVTLRYGTKASFKQEAGKVLSANMDRRRPLWDITLFRGLKGNRTGLMLRMHHCLADGISGVGLLNTLMDMNPDPPVLPKKKVRFQLPPERDAAASLLEGFVTSCFSASQAVLTAQSELMKVVQQVTSAARDKRPPGADAQGGVVPDPRIPSLQDINRLLVDIARPADRLPFNVVCRGPQNFNWAELSIPDINAIKEACGTKLNDVVLTVVTLAIQRYATLHGVGMKDRLLRIVVPVNVRGDGGTEGIGNLITFLPVSIPMDISDPRKLLAAVHERMVFLKNARVAEAVGLAGSLLATVPGAMQALVGPIASQLPLSLCNLICTNVPGPRMPLYLIGHKMMSCYPYVPIGGEMGLNIAILTYNEKAFFGFTGDLQAIPDIRHLDGFLEQSFQELKKAAGIVTPKPKQKNRKPAKRVKKAGAAKAVGAVPKTHVSSANVGHQDKFATAKPKTHATSNNVGQHEAPADATSVSTPEVAELVPEPKKRQVEAEEATNAFVAVAGN